jgi:hypothetical protein
MQLMGMNLQPNHSQPDSGKHYYGDGVVEEGQAEDMMMSIPKEGNAEQLNKSTKLTLSSKKTEQLSQYSIKAPGYNLAMPAIHGNR